MSTERTAESNAESFTSEGAALLAAAALSILFMAHHPEIHATSAAEAVTALARIALAGRVVHGVLIAVLVVVAWAVLGLARRLGFERTTVRFGALAYVAGGGAMVAAALMNGLIVPAFAAGYAGVPAAQVEAITPSLRLCHEVNQACAQFGSIAIAGALLFLSIELLKRRGAPRIAGVYGIAQGVAVAAALTTGLLRLDVHGMLLVVVAHALWYGTVGVLLLRRRL